LQVCVQSCFRNQTFSSLISPFQPTVRLSTSEAMIQALPSMGHYYARQLL
jgi:hypothetical protein